MPLRPDMNYRDYIDVLGRRKSFILGSFILVLCGAGAYLFAATPLYKSTTTILVISQRVPDNFVRSTVTAGLEDRLATIQQQVTSRTRLMKVREELGLLEKDKERFDDATMRDRIAINVLHDPADLGRGGGPKEGFSLSYMDEDPELAMLTTSKLASVFIEENLKTRERLAAGTSKLLEEELKETKGKLEDQEKRVNHYKMQHSGELPQELQSSLANLESLRNQFRVISDEIREMERRKFQFQSQISTMQRGPQAIVKKDGKEEVDTTRDSAEALIAELTTRRNQLSELIAKYTEFHPDVIRVRREVEQLEQKIAQTESPPRPSGEHNKNDTNRRTYLPLGGREREEILALRTQIASAESEIVGLKREKDGIQGRIAVLQGKLNRIPRSEEELIVLTRDYDNLKNLYNDLLKKKMEANIAENLEDRHKGEQFQVLDPANLPKNPSKPETTKIMLLALLLATGVGFGGAILLEEMDQTLRGVKDFRHFFDLKIFACIPDLDEEAPQSKVSLLTFYKEQIRILLKI